MTTLTLIRGLPGSGKSTLAKSMLRKNFLDTVHVEADMYFIDNTGKYVFDRTKLSEAHEWCLNYAQDAMQDGENVIVSNTFTTYAEMRPYVKLALAMDFKLEVLTCTGNYGSIHDVPQEAIDRMMDRWETFNCEKYV